MVIKEADLRDWSIAAWMWYNKATDKSPNVGRIQHQLAVLTRPNIGQQPFRHSNALVNVVQFQNERESIVFLLTRFLDGSEIAGQQPPLVETAFIIRTAI
jgi:hypothetical protein